MIVEPRRSTRRTLEPELGSRRRHRRAGVETANLNRAQRRSVAGPGRRATTAIELRTSGVRLLAVLTFPDTDELEVHLTFEGRRIIGRAVASNGILGVVEAMVDGLKVFVPRLRFSPSWARVLDDDGRDVHVVACELLAPDDSRRLGIASGASAIEAAARATLHALEPGGRQAARREEHEPA